MTPESEMARLMALLESDWKPTPQQRAEAEAALSREPKHPQQTLPLGGQ